MTYRKDVLKWPAGRNSDGEWVEVLFFLMVTHKNGMCYEMCKVLRIKKVVLGEQFS